METHNHYWTIDHIWRCATVALSLSFLPCFISAAPGVYICCLSLTISLGSPIWEGNKGSHLTVTQVLF